MSEPRWLTLHRGAMLFAVLLLVFLTLWFGFRPAYYTYQYSVTDTRQFTFSCGSAFSHQVQVIGTNYGSATFCASLRTPTWVPVLTAAAAVSLLAAVTTRRTGRRFPQ